MKKLVSHLITECWQVELMRNIYNDNLDMLSTKPLPYRTYEEQQKWWNNNKIHLRAFLYEPLLKPGKYVAFLVLRIRDGFATPTIAIQKEEWGSGYGQEIVCDYIQKANGPLAGTQLQSNSAICHINKKMGWIILGSEEQPTGSVDLLFHPGIISDKVTKTVFANVLDYLNINKNVLDFNLTREILR